MLYNQSGQVVVVNNKYNSKENPNMFINLREVKEPLPPAGNMFKLSERAKFKQ